MLRVVCLPGMVMGVAVDMGRVGHISRYIITRDGNKRRARALKRKNGLEGAKNPAPGMDSRGRLC